MRSITHREMRNNSAEILRAVAAGETVHVTNRGRVAAVISPPNQPTLARLVADGQARAARQPVARLTSLPRRKSPISTADLVADVRRRW
jgi:prevent-host-death family protein